MSFTGTGTWSCPDCCGGRFSVDTCGGRLSVDTYDVGRHVIGLSIDAPVALLGYDEARSLALAILRALDKHEDRP